MNVSAGLRKLMLSAVAAVLALVSAQAFAQYSNIDRVVVFGTSLSDTGNSFVWLSDPINGDCGRRISLPPYDMLDDLLTPDGPYAKGGHHFSNGANWVEGMARSLALAGNARPAFKSGGLKASNYSAGGARAVLHPCRLNLPQQVAAYVQDFSATSPKTLVVIEIGSNDLRDALFAAAGGGDPAPYIANALNGLVTAIMTLRAHGADKFLLANAPNLARAPAVVLLNQANPGTAFYATLLSQAYNQGFGAVVQMVNAMGVQVRVLDLYGAIEQIMAAPASFGFANTTEACVTPNVPPFFCRNPDSYVFWDGVHPTKATHAILAQKALTTVLAP